MNFVLTNISTKFSLYDTIDTEEFICDALNLGLNIFNIKSNN